MGLKYPIGEQDFQSIREKNKVYVDKTRIIFDLSHHSKYIFLSRPRRFGKSLLLSTLKAYFEGRKELFKGLAIEDIEKEWRVHPVLHLSLSSTNTSLKGSLGTILEEQFSVWENLYGITEILPDFSARFRRIIREATEQTGEKIVILIDEYDNPLIDTLHRDEIHESNKELLKSIYSNLKDMDEYIRFAMLTGVSRFSRAGIFSGLNNLNDISFDNRYSAICGFTEDEIKKFLWPGVEELALRYNETPEGALALLKREYDGYHFSEELIDIYNPFSLLNALDFHRIENYWVQSGTPEFLARHLELSEDAFSELFNEEADTTDLMSEDTVFNSPVALLYQTGYLTIKSFDLKKNLYKLGIPNKEVREGLFSYLLSDSLQKDRRKAIRETEKLRELLESGKPEEFLERMKTVMAGIPYRLTSKAPEIYFENNLYVMLQLMGLEVKAEEETSFGRIDLTVKTKKYIYIIEIKADKSAGEALRQIEEKEYALKYTGEGRKIFCIGISFSSKKRNIEEYKII